MTFYLGLIQKLVLFTPKDIFSLLRKVKEYNVSCLFGQFKNPKFLLTKVRLANGLEQFTFVGAHTMSIPVDGRLDVAFIYEDLKE